MTYDMNLLPQWDQDGYIPPMDENVPVSFARSPYAISVVDLMMVFGTTEPRRRLLVGLLDFRRALHQAGLIKGVQWIDGSFVRDVEKFENRNPDDIDVVTFFYIPDGYQARDFFHAFPDLLHNESTRERFGVDSYCFQLNQITSEEIISQSTYWYSLWSHTVDGRWKGYLEIDLSDGDDAQARPSGASSPERPNWGGPTKRLGTQPTGLCSDGLRAESTQAHYRLGDRWPHLPTGEPCCLLHGLYRNGRYPAPAGGHGLVPPGRT